MNIQFKRIIYAILIIINCIIIFNFSAQNAEKSSKTSNVIVNKIVTDISKKNTKMEKENIANNVTFIVRKTAHFSIYTLLGILLISDANTFKINNKTKLLICLLFGLLYAASDEFHQKFVSGRSSEIRDVCIDTLGVLFGNLLVIITGIIIKKCCHIIYFNRKSYR